MGLGWVGLEGRRLLGDRREGEQRLPLCANGARDGEVGAVDVGDGGVGCGCPSGLLGRSAVTSWSSGAGAGMARLGAHVTGLACKRGLPRDTSDCSGVSRAVGEEAAVALAALDVAVDGDTGQGPRGDPASSRFGPRGEPPFCAPRVPLTVRFFSAVFRRLKLFKLFENHDRPMLAPNESRPTCCTSEGCGRSPWLFELTVLTMPARGVIEVLT